MPSNSQDDTASFEYDTEAFDSAAGVGAQRQAAAQRARAAQRQLDRRIAGIRRPLQDGVRLGRLEPVAGSTGVVVELPNGRSTRMQISPAPASARSVNQLRAQIAANDLRQRRALDANARAIGRLGAAQAAAVKQLTARQLASSKAWTKRMVDGDARLDARLTTELAKVKRRASGPTGSEAKSLARAQRRSLWNSLLVATGLPFFAAYGRVDDPFARTNLMLTGSLAGWMIGDEVIDRLAVDPPAKGSPKERARRARSRQAWSRGADLWSYLAPVGNAATVWYLLEDQQHARFITGVTTVSFSTEGFSGNRVELEVAEGYRDDFRKMSDVRAVATVVSPASVGVLGVRAAVTSGVLELTPTFGSTLVSTGSVTIAWIVDVRGPSA